MIHVLLIYDLHGLLHWTPAKRYRCFFPTKRMAPNSYPKSDGSTIRSRSSRNAPKSRSCD